MMVTTGPIMLSMREKAERAVERAQAADPVLTSRREFRQRCAAALTEAAVGQLSHAVLLDFLVAQLVIAGRLDRRVL